MTKEYGDWVDVPLKDYTEWQEHLVRETQREQIALAIKELGDKPYSITWIDPKVVLAWKITVEDD